MNLWIRYIALSTCVLSAWAQPVAAPTAPITSPNGAASPTPVITPASPEPTSALDAVMFYQVLLGELYAQGGESSTGFSLILDAARKAKDPALFQRAVELALQSRSGEAALQAARTWKQVTPGSADANRYILQILLALNKVEEAGQALKSALASLPVEEQTAAIASVPRIFSRVNDKLLALHTVESALSQALSQPGTQASAWTTIGRMRRDVGQSQGAAMAAQKGHAADKQAPGPILLALSVLDKEPELVQPLLLSYMAGPALPELRLGYARALISMQKNASALVQLQKLNQDKPEFALAWLFSGLLLSDMDQPAQASQALRQFVGLAGNSEDAEVQNGLSEAYFSLAQIAQQQGQWAQADAWLSQMPAQTDPIKLGVRRANLLVEQGQLQQARQLLTHIPTTTPAQARLKLLALAMFLREHKEYQAAYDLLTPALKNGADYEMQSELALTAEKMGQFELMESLLREMMAAKPNDAHPLNALGFSLADRNIRLSEAKQLIEQAVALAPNDAFIRDSLAWVVYRLGDLAQALSLLESAYKAKPDVEIAAHWGEVLWVSGQTQQAGAIWREGFLLKSDNETLRDTFKRFQFKP
jgi:tetratricopeptide (TPR) repeat protein